MFIERECRATGVSVSLDTTFPIFDPAVQETLTSIRQCVSLRSLTAIVREAAEAGILDEIRDAVQRRRAELKGVQGYSDAAQQDVMRVVSSDGGVAQGIEGREYADQRMRQAFRAADVDFSDPDA